MKDLIRICLQLKWLPDRGDTHALRGLSVIELLLVVGVIAVITSIAVPVYSEFKLDAKNNEAIEHIKQLERRIDEFYKEHERYPNNMSEIGREGIVDPWGNPYAYLNITAAGTDVKPRKWHNIHPINSDYDCYSKGKDGKSKVPLTSPESRDDIVRARNGEFIGVVADM